MRTYQQHKEEARNRAIEWQNANTDRAISYGALVAAQAIFEDLGRRYGLLREFRENGIC